MKYRVFGAGLSAALLFVAGCSSETDEPSKMVPSGSAEDPSGATDDPAQGSAPGAGEEGGEEAGGGDETGADGESGARGEGGAGGEGTFDRDWPTETLVVETRTDLDGELQAIGDLWFTIPDAWEEIYSGATTETDFSYGYGPPDADADANAVAVPLFISSLMRGDSSPEAVDEITELFIGGVEYHSEIEAELEVEWEAFEYVRGVRYIEYDYDKLTVIAGAGDRDVVLIELSVPLGEDLEESDVYEVFETMYVERNN